MRTARAIALVMAFCAAGSAPASAQEAHRWLVHGRVIVIVPDASSTPAGLDAKPDATIEVGVTRHLSPRFALEFTLATASHEIAAGGSSLGSASQVLPAFLLQYRPLPGGLVSPYAGAGASLPVFYARSGGLEQFDLSGRLGWALQGGADLRLTPRSVLNLDLKYLHTAADIESGGSRIYRLRIHPWVVGAGLGYRF